MKRPAKYALALALAAALAPSLAQPKVPEPIVVGSILDETGPLNVYGKPMVQATRLAVAQINAAGGVLGRPLKLVEYDAQSDNAKYTTYANQLALRDKAAVIMGGIASSARDAVRPVAKRHGLVYFYNEQYEGGVCEKNVFLPGTVPSQQTAPMVEWAAQNVGKRFYILAADYNYGHLTAQWIKHYAAKAGAKVLGADFIPLDVAEFGSVIARLQDARPDVVFSSLIGGNHIAFYRQFAAAGLNSRMQIVSTTFGQGNEHIVLAPHEAQGIVASYPYFQEIDSEANRRFRALWSQTYGSQHDYITDGAVITWNGWHLWAAAVNKAGSLAREKVIAALESGLEFDSPSGHVRLHGPSHHLIQNTHFARANDQRGFTVLGSAQAVPPAFEQSVCDLLKNPKTAKQFVPDAQ